jgi:hypothetical protein
MTLCSLRQWKKCQADSRPRGWLSILSAETRALIARMIQKGFQVSKSVTLFVAFEGSLFTPEGLRIIVAGMKDF